MRVVLVSNLFPPDIGGPATHISRLAGDLFARGHRVRVIVAAEDPRVHGDEPYPVRRVSRRLPVPLRFALVFVWTWLAALFADVVYVNGLELPATAAARCAFRPAILKIVGDFSWEYAIRHRWTDDGIDPYQTRRYPLRVELVRFAQRLYCRLAGRIVVPSRYLRGLVQVWGIPVERIHVVNNALVGRPRVIHAAEDLRRQLDLSGPIVLTVARLYPWKQIDDLIRMSLDFSGDARLVIVGDGPERAALERLAADLDAPATFVGAVDQQDVFSYLKAADLFVLNTRYEGMSHVLLEARWAGVPIVTTDVGGNLEILESDHDALLVPYGDHPAMTAAINRILTDPALATRLGDAARTDLDHYTWDRQVDETLHLLRPPAG
ncbi:MAG TPA: glycosyltransferase family 4 protein [Chloroflexota bacterium]|nr:glycosyltransferase family 4 protein [Chloroflexota bacterium]